MSVENNEYEKIVLFFLKKGKVEIENEQGEFDMDI
jgi:hypothetical protein